MTIIRRGGNDSPVNHAMDCLRCGGHGDCTITWPQCWTMVYNRYAFWDSWARREPILRRQEQGRCQLIRKKLVKLPKSKRFSDGRLALFCALAAASLSATPALANWQSTRWGMSVDEVLAAVPGSIPHSNSKLDVGTQVVRAAANYNAGGVDSVAFLLFEGGLRFSRVLILPKKMENCSDLSRKLHEAYGEPLDSTGHRSIFSYRWRDTDKGNIVVYANIGYECSISYWSLKESNGL